MTLPHTAAIYNLPYRGILGKTIQLPSKGTLFLSSNELISYHCISRLLPHISKSLDRQHPQISCEGSWVQSRVTGRALEPPSQPRQPAWRLVIRRQPLHQSCPRLPLFFFNKRATSNASPFRCTNNCNAAVSSGQPFDFTMACTMWICWYQPSTPLNTGNSVSVNLRFSMTIFRKSLFLRQVHPVRHQNFLNPGHGHQL